METEFDIVCIGNICLDSKMVVEEFLVGEKFRAKSHELLCGGPAAVASAVAGKYGLNVGFIGAIADDPNGEFLLNKLKSFCVNTEYVTVINDSNIHTAFAAVMVRECDGERTISSFHHEKLVVEELKPFRTKVLLLDGQEPKASFKAMEMNPEAKTMLDAGRYKESVIELAKRVDIPICSKDFAERWVKEATQNNNFVIDDLSSIIETFEVMSKDLHNNIVITIGKKGCVYKENDNIVLLPPTDDKAVDTTGAGDIFHGAFAVAIANGFSFHDALIFAIIVSGLSVTKPGGITSIPDADEVNQAWILYNSDPNKRPIYLKGKNKTLNH